MLQTIKNHHLQVTVDTLGAQLMNITAADGTEYLWQGNPSYWSDRSPALFPVIARLYGEKYQLKGKEYPMTIHGFAAQSEFCIQEKSPTQLTLRLNQAPKESYPFPFVFDISYRLEDHTLHVGYTVSNTGTDFLHFGIGGHPGFRVPLEEGKAFEDYRLEFSQPCTPYRVGFTSQILVSGETTPYSLQENRYLPLSHNLFDDDAIILGNCSRNVRLAAKDGHGLEVDFPDMPYLGFWHWPKTDAPYVCIEPWSSLPGRQDVTEDLALKEDLIHLPAGNTYQNNWSITIF